MDIKINGATNLQTEYGQYNIDNLGKATVSNSDTKRREVLLRNADTFKKVAEGYYDKKEVYQGTSSFDVNEAEQAIEKAGKETSALECIGMLKSNITPEDYNALEEWGLIPDEDNIESFVGVYERIQIELAAYCEDYEAGPNIDKEKLEAVLGSESFANAVAKTSELASETNTLSDNAKKYILLNELDPTVENVYKALHSGMGVKTGTAKLTDADWQQLQGQVETFFNANGIESSNDNLDSAKWLIDENIPLTLENFLKLQGLDKVDFGNADYMENLNQDIAYTIYFGENPMKATVTGESYDMEQIAEAVNTVQNAMDQDVDYILKNNKKLNIENLKQRVLARQKEDEQRARQGRELERYTQSSSLLADARAVLTQGSLFAMQKVGISITYTEITVMVDVARGQTMSLSAQILSLDMEASNIEDADKSLLATTMEMMSSFSSMPIDVAGRVYSESISFTVEAVYTEGQIMASRYRAAMMTYEAVGTEVRGDLGDNIAKAFRNVDDILEELNIEVNDKNRRSARVLGYNTMEITKEAVEAIGDITSQLDELTENLTPRAAAYLIKNGINPLNTDIRELNEQLEVINNELEAKSHSEKYSEYLWKLEKKGDITKEERDAYIQLYRVINQINKYDGRALGAVSKAGQQMTLANLYTAVKTRQSGGIDKKLDAEFGLLENEYTEDALTAYMEGVQSLMEDETLHREYQNERIQEKLNLLSTLETMSEQEFMRYVSGKEGTSINNLYTYILAGHKEFYKKLKDLDDDSVVNAADKITDIWQSEDDNSETDVINTYNSFKDTISKENEEYTFDKSVLRTDMNMAVSFMARQAEKKSYYIPMEISGETTMVHMTLKEGDSLYKGRITIFAQIGEGSLSALIYRKEESYETLMATNDETIRDSIKAITNSSIVVTDKVYDGMWNDTITDTDGANVGYGELVRQAKSFIHNVLKKI